MRYSPNLQPEGLSGISQGLSESASDTPGQRSEEEMHPGWVQATPAWYKPFWHPFRVLLTYCRVSGGVAPLNPRLISRTPSACLISETLMSV